MFGELWRAERKINGVWLLAFHIVCVGAVVENVDRRRIENLFEEFARGVESVFGSPVGAPGVEVTQD